MDIFRTGLIYRTLLLGAVFVATAVAPPNADAYNRNDALNAIEGIASSWSGPDVEPWINDSRGVQDTGVFVDDPVAFRAASSEAGFFTFLFVDAKGEVSVFQPSTGQAATEGSFEGLTQNRPLGEQFLFAVQSEAPIPAGRLQLDAELGYRVVGADLDSVSSLVNDLKSLSAEMPLAMSPRYSYFVDGDTKISVRGMAIGVKRQMAQVRKPVPVENSAPQSPSVAQPLVEMAVVEQPMVEQPLVEQPIVVAAADPVVTAPAVSSSMAIPAEVETVQPEVSLQAQPASTDRHSSGMQLDIKFEFNSSELTFEGQQQLDVLGNSLVELQGNGNLPTVILEGHTDSEGAWRYNLELSAKRANSAKAYLASTFGLPTGNVLAKGMGEDYPVANNDDAAGRASNRRVVLKVQE